MGLYGPHSVILDCSERGPGPTQVVSEAPLMDIAGPVRATHALTEGGGGDPGGSAPWGPCIRREMTTHAS